MVNEEKGHGSFASPCASLDEKPEVGSDVGSSRDTSVVAHFPPALLPGAPAPDGPDVFGQIDVDSADFWTNRSLSSSSRSRAEELVSKHSNTRTLKSG